MKHQIELKDIAEGTITHELAGSYGKGVNKSLILVVQLKPRTIYYEIRDGIKHTTFETAMPEVAVQTYNEI